MGNSLFLILLLLSGLSVSLGAPAAGPVFKAGFAERDITPGIGMEKPGGYGKVFHRRFHDPCKVRVALFDDGGTKVVLAGIDALMIPRALVLAARAEITRTLGIPGKAILVAASHSHSSGPVGMVQPGQFDTAPEDIRRLAYEESSAADPGYLLRLQHEIVEAVKAADAARVPAHLGFGFGHEDQVSFNRRLRMKNGRTVTHPGAMNPDIIDYAGPIDPQVGVVGSWDADGRLLGTIVNFACHATTTPDGISANYIHYLERTIQGALDTRAPVVFLAGASGDVTQVDNRSPALRPTGEAWAKLVGGRIGAEAVKTLLAMPRGDRFSLDARQRIWRIDRRPPSTERVERARATIAAGRNAENSTDWTLAKEILMLTHLIAVEPAVEVEVQALQVGPAVFVSNPAEYFVQYGLEIKRGSPFPLTFPVSLANGCVGYVPTEEAFGPGGGGYETRLTAYSNLEITAGRQFAETGIALARAMQPDPLPQFPPIRAAGRPWALGNAPPEVN